MIFCYLTTFWFWGLGIRAYYAVCIVGEVAGGGYMTVTVGTSDTWQVPHKTVSGCFSPFVSVSIRFWPFLSASDCVCPFLSTSVRFYPFLSISVCFGLFQVSGLLSAHVKQTCNLSQMQWYCPFKILIFGIYFCSEHTLFCKKECFCRIVRSFSHTFSCPQAYLG